MLLTTKKLITSALVLRRLLPKQNFFMDESLTVF